MSKLMFETSIQGAYMWKYSNYFKIMILSGRWLCIILDGNIFSFPVHYNFFLKKIWDIIFLEKNN